MEVDLHGGGIDARGAAFPGAALHILIGRGQDFAWSATSAGSDVIDQYVETLCGNDTTYHYRGRCVQMKTIRAGASGGWWRAHTGNHVHRDGPRTGRRVCHRGRRTGRDLAEALDMRRDVINALAFADLNANRPHSPKSFITTMSQVEFTFNWFYADDRDIAVYSSGACPAQSGSRRGAAHTGNRPLRMAGLPAGPAPPSPDERAQRRGPELEQQAGGGLRCFGQQLGLRLDPQGSAARGRDQKRIRRARKVTS